MNLSPQGRSRATSINRKLRRALMAACGSAVVGCGLFLLFSIIWYKGELKRRLAISGEMIAVAAVAAVDFNDPDEARKLIQSLEKNPAVLAAAFYRDDRVFASYVSSNQTNLVPVNVPLDGTDLQMGEYVGGLTNPVGKRVGSIYIRPSPDLLHKFVWLSVVSFFVTVLVASAVALPLAARMQRVVTDPIHHLLTVTQRVGVDNDFSLRAHKLTDDEFGQLTDSFNRMLAQIQSRDDELLRHRHHLEDEVTARTRELQLLNEDLALAKSRAEEANRAKSRFLANMSHELRTPLNAIIGYSEMLQEEADDLGTPEIKPDLQKIHGAGQHLLELINDILDLSKIEAGKMTLYLETFEVQILLNEVADIVQPLISKNGNKLTLEVAPEIGSMRADVTKVRQALLNLLSNASKFTDKGSITLRARRQGANLVFDVIDSGIGMTPEQVSRLFQAFAQADASTSKKYGGTGLGLALSRKFCQLMGGDLSVASESGNGSTFTATIPAQVSEVAEEMVPALSAPVAEIPSTGSGPLVLVIDDDTTVLDILRRSLNRDGFRVETAPDGISGLARARELHPDIITLDVMMPGMDGWEVLAALKEDPETADIPVIVVSIVDERGLGFSLGAADYLTKPLDFSRLSSVLKRHAKVDLSRRVLVVEDDEATQELLQKRLTKEGWQVVVAGNGREALERLTQGPPDLVLLDLMMPEMDGFEFLEAFRKQPGCACTTVVVMTSKIFTQADHQRLRGQVAQVVAKANLSPEMLAAEIWSALGKPLHQP